MKDSKCTAYPTESGANVGSTSISNCKCTKGMNMIGDECKLGTYKAAGRCAPCPDKVTALQLLAVFRIRVSATELLCLLPCHLPSV